LRISKLKRIKNFFLQWRTFGLTIAFWNFLPSNNKKHKFILSYLYNNFKDIIDKYAHKTPQKLTPVSPEAPIWVCWWQGEEAMPPIVKCCFNSVKRYSGTHPVILITKDNVSDYITIPPHIINKVDKGIITITHFSNIVRMLLLAKYGGLWLDATILVTGDINFTNNPLSFFTIHRDFGGNYITKRRWAGNCIGAGISGIYLFDFIFELLSEYWKEYNVFIDYFLYDYSIALAYNYIPYIKQMIDDVPLNNKNYSLLKPLLKREFDQDIYNDIIKDTIFHKLKYVSQTMTSDKKLTFYGYMSNKYKVYYEL